MVLSDRNNHLLYNYLYNINYDSYFRSKLPCLLAYRYSIFHGYIKHHNMTYLILVNYNIEVQ